MYVLFHIQCPSPLYIATLDIATSSPVTNIRQYINSDLKIQPLCSKIATVISFEVAISNALSFYMLNFTFYYQMSFGNSDRAAYSDLNPRDGGQSLYPMSTVLSVLCRPWINTLSCQIETPGVLLGRFFSMWTCYKSNVSISIFSKETWEHYWTEP